MVTTYNQVEVSPVDALWTLIQGQSKAVRVALTKRLLEQEKAALAAKAVDAKKFTQKINALENDSAGPIPAYSNLVFEVELVDFK